MKKIRVHELVKELNELNEGLGLSNKAFIEEAHKMNIEINNHMSSLDIFQVDMFKKKYAMKVETQPEVAIEKTEVKKKIKEVKEETKETVKHEVKDHAKAVHKVAPKAEEHKEESKVVHKTEHKEETRADHKEATKVDHKAVEKPVTEVKSTATTTTAKPSTGTGLGTATYRPVQGSTPAKPSTGTGLGTATYRPVQGSTPAKPSTGTGLGTATYRPVQGTSPAKPSTGTGLGTATYRPVQGTSSVKPQGTGTGTATYRSTQGTSPARPSSDRPSQGGNYSKPAGHKPTTSVLPTKPTSTRTAQHKSTGYTSTKQSEQPKTNVAKKSEKYKKIDETQDVVAGAERIVTKSNMKPQLKPQNNRYNNNRYGNKKNNWKNNNFKSGEPKIEVQIKTLKMINVISVKDLSEHLGKPATEIIKKLFLLGIMATINQELDFDTTTLICADYNIDVEKQLDKEDEEILLKEDEDKEEELQERPPIVTIMGHVDHGKTSLLDAIRKTNVISTEAGGITQHIGAYTVTINNKKITFLDTPGHEAFTAMRARGASVTDIAIIVVAADDGIMPQTVEAINHAKAANVQLIVAINKIDKPAANIEKVKQELATHGLQSEDWGGDTICVPVSAKKGEGIDHLLEMILLVAELQELKANPNRLAVGTVVEAKLDKSRGPIATVLIQKGTLNIGDNFVVGHTYGKIRAMIDDKGKKVKKAGPAMPVEIIGLSEVPDAGDVFTAVIDEKTAKIVAENRKSKERETHLISNAPVTLEDLFSQIQEGKVKELNLVVKADVQGSVEAIKQSLVKLNNDEVKVNVIHGGAGAINETDIMLASASNAIVLGFNVRPQASVAALAEKSQVDVKLYSIIYDAIEDIKAAMTGMLDPEFEEVVLGHVEVRATFKVSNVGTIAGGYVLDGKIGRNNDIRLLRENIVIVEGKLASLKRFKDDVKEVNSGFECGLNIEKFNDIQEGDIIEAFEMQAVARK